MILTLSRDICHDVKTSMTVVKMHCFYHCLVIEISFDVKVIKQINEVGVVFNIVEVVEFKNKSRDLDE